MNLPSKDEKQRIAEELLSAKFYPTGMTPSFEAYFNHYQSILCPRDANDVAIGIETPALQSHEYVLRCAKSLYKHRLSSRDKITRQWFSSQPSTEIERNHVSRSVVDVSFMVNCDERDYYPNGHFGEGQGAKWGSNQTFVNFLEEAFPLQEDVNISLSVDEKKSLKAWKLSRRYGIRIKGTDNLLDHLLYNPKDHTLLFFHHVTYLRAQLWRSKNMSLDLNFQESLALQTPPPQLLLETLLSIHALLFPIADYGNERSNSLLKKCVKEQELDRELLWVDYVRPISTDFIFKYWGRRLEKIQQLIERPPPRNTLVAWFERHTSERNALTVAIIGLFLTALFGFLGVVIGVLQLIVAWSTWKHPR